MKELTRKELDVYTGGDLGMVLAGGGFGGGGGGGFGSVGSGGVNLGLGGFDLGSVASDIGGAAYTPATVPNGLFSMSIAENLGVATGLGALVTAIGNGVNASYAIEAAGGGWSGLAAAGTGVGGTAFLGVAAALGTGALAGSAFYHYSPDWAQTIMQDVVGHTVETLGAIPDVLVQVNAWIVGVPVHGGPGNINRLVP